MDTDRERLPGYQPPTSTSGPSGSPGGPSAGTTVRLARNNGIKRVRTMSNWTAAALLVGTGATTVALATHSFPVSTTTTSSTSATNAAGAPTANAPHVGGPVTTSGGSGATVTTTSHVVNGKTVVTRVTHPAAYHDR